ncbi:hypothetical protein FOCG_18455, partial [Fusarium oxysporum f. sp. radicis-lycopersici 26381]
MAAIVAILLRFTLNRSRPCFQRLDLIAASTPLFLVDLVVLEILVGLLVWYTSSFTARFATYLGIELLVLMVSQAGHGLNDPQEQQPLVIKLGDL